MPTVYVTIAKPGHGKSFIANYIAEQTGAIHINVDEVRHELTNGNPQYTSEESRETYDELLKQGKKHYENGEDVILDGTFNLVSGRDRIYDIAGDDVEFIKIECDEETAKQRLANRSGISDANPEVYDKFSMIPINYDHTVIDNTGTKQDAKQQFDQKLL